MSVGSGDKRLSKMQKRVLDLLAEGRSPMQIAAHLERKPTTVQTHIKRARTLLGVETTIAAAVKWALMKNHSEAEYRSWT
jgi:DNA-binding CsgD family transcriptional regulator